MSKIILHLDMNSYFASVEQQANPHLRGRPVGVCEHLGGIIIAPSVEAKRLGIKLGTPVWEAVKIYPKIVLLPTDPDKYRAVTERFMTILEDYSDEVERYSIDEAFVDITKIVGHNPSPPPLTLRGGVPPLKVRGGEGELWNEALLVALEIKHRLRQEVGEWVSCSIGIGPNKLVAKIAADLDHGVIASLPRADEAIPSEIRLPRRFAPRNDKALLDRICVIKPDDVQLLYDYLALTDIPGIGKRTERALNKLGIFNLRRLRDYPLPNLLNQFGVWGYVLKEISYFGVIARNEMTKQSQWDRHSPTNVRPRDDMLTKEGVPKSIGHMYTLPRAIENIKDIKRLMFKLSEKVGRRMRRHGARGNVVHYFHSDKQHHSFHKQHKSSELINDGRDIYRAVQRIFIQSPRINIKIMGLSVSGLYYIDPPEPLFEQYKKSLWLTRAMDQINDKYGEYTISRALLLNTDKVWAKDTVGFGRVVEL